MHELVNLAVDLGEERFGRRAIDDAAARLQAAGFAVERSTSGPDPFLAWIDWEFGGAWSSEAFAGKNVIVRSGKSHAAFATYNARDLAYAWLRGAASEKGTGIFGPFGVDARFRGSELGAPVLTLALAELRNAGYVRAVIPAVGDDKLIAYYAAHAGARVVERFAASTWNTRRYRTVVLASGSGSNFQSVIDGAGGGSLPLDLVLLLSNKPQAYAIERARAARIAAVALPWDRKSQSREQYDEDLVQMVEREEPDLVLLLGWMHVLSDAFIRKFPHVINIHPAFLPLDQTRDEVGFPDGSVTPAFRGAHAVRDALAWGSRWAGASCHRVTPDADRGPVLVRKPLEIAAGESEEAVMQRLHPMEHRVLAGGIRRWVFER